MRFLAYVRVYARAEAGESAPRADLGLSACVLRAVCAAKEQQIARGVGVRCGRPCVDIRFLSAVASATNRAAGAMAEGDGFLPSRISGTQLSVTLRARGEYARGEGIVLSFSRLSTARAV